MALQKALYSNTTLVKVKWNAILKERENPEFKYNTC